MNKMNKRLPYLDELCCATTAIRSLQDYGYAKLDDFLTNCYGAIDESINFCAFDFETETEINLISMDYSRFVGSNKKVLDFTNFNVLISSITIYWNSHGRHISTCIIDETPSKHEKNTKKKNIKLWIPKSWFPDSWLYDNTSHVRIKLWSWHYNELSFNYKSQKHDGKIINNVNNYIIQGKCSGCDSIIDSNNYTIYDYHEYSQYCKACIKKGLTECCENCGKRGENIYCDSEYGDCCLSCDRNIYMDLLYRFRYG